VLQLHDHAAQEGSVIFNRAEVDDACDAAHCLTLTRV
jgi:hypothetical protein